MSFFKETDYHGTRTYSADTAAYAFVDHLRLKVSLTFAWARLRIEKCMRLGVPPSQTSSLMHRGEKHFTLLGNRPPVLPANRPISEIFAISNSNDHPRKRRNDN